MLTSRMLRTAAVQSILKVLNEKKNHCSVPIFGSSKQLDLKDSFHVSLGGLRPYLGRGENHTMEFSPGPGETGRVRLVGAQTRTLPLHRICIYSKSELL